MSYSHIKKTIVEVVPEGLNVAVNKFIPLVLNYVVSKSAPLVIRFSGPSDTKIREYRHADDKVRSGGVITYLRTPYDQGKEKDNDFSTFAYWACTGSRASFWKLDLGSVYSTVYLIGKAGSGANGPITWYIKVSADDQTYTDVYSASIPSYSYDQCVLTLSNVRYIIIDANGSTSATFYLHELYAYTAPHVKEVTAGTSITVYENSTYGEAIEVFLFSPGTVSYWGFLKDNCKISLTEGTVT